MTLIWFAVTAVVAYLILTLYLSLLVQQIPRRPVTDPPDWGSIEDTFVPAIDSGKLEVWRIEPDGESRGTILLAHGWGRNRDRMVNRARMFGSMGYTTVIHSARDHGNSSPSWVMNALRFSEDIESVIDWIGKPVILYGHSAGSGGAIITAARRPESVQLLFLEASYAYTRPALLSLYRWFNWWVGTLLGPMILIWMNVYYRGALDRLSPIRLAPAVIAPVMLIHGEKDRRFPADFAVTLRHSFQPGQATLFIAPGAGHSNSSSSSGYRQAVQAFLESHSPNKI
jgi:pimeloyl-ACP methyl ester carboxylesterase